MSFHYRLISSQIELVIQIFALHWRSLLLLSLFTTAVSTSAFSGSAAYTYDSLGRLSTVTYSTGIVITYAYDAAGNRISYVTTGAP